VARTTLDAMKNLRYWIACALLGASCATSPLPRQAPPLAAMQEPLEFMDEPQDESERVALPKGAFTGVVVGDARASLDAMLSEPSGLLVTRIIENSPAAIAGLVEGDLLVEARGSGEPVALAWPADWRRLELETEAGATLHVVVDRAGAELEMDIVTVARVAAAGRAPTARFREEARAGIVVRSATEVEARRAALGPGGGAVLVGMTRESPWRGAVLYGDLIRAIDGVEVQHPQVLLEALRTAPKDAVVKLELMRGDKLVAVDAPLSRRQSEWKSISLQPLYSFSRERDLATHSILLGLVRWRTTPAAWDLRLLWWFEWRGGDSNRLESVKP